MVQIHAANDVLVGEVNAAIAAEAVTAAQANLRVAYHTGTVPYCIRYQYIYMYNIYIYQLCSVPFFFSLKAIVRVSVKGCNLRLPEQTDKLIASI